MQVESTSKPMLTVDEVEQIQRKKVATIIGHKFQLTYAAFFDKLVQEEKSKSMPWLHYSTSQSKTALLPDV